MSPERDGGVVTGRLHAEPPRSSSQCRPRSFAAATSISATRAALRPRSDACTERTARHSNGLCEHAETPGHCRAEGVRVRVIRPAHLRTRRVITAAVASAPSSSPPIVRAIVTPSALIESKRDAARPADVARGIATASCVSKSTRIKSCP